MGATSIEWTERSWNPIRGCSKISPGCENCYAMHVAARFSDAGQSYQGLAKRNPVNWTGEVRMIERTLLEPLRRRAPTTYFVNSMSDLFHENMPRDWIAKIFGVMAYCRRHTFQVLTKRAERMLEIVSSLSVDECLNAVGLAPGFLPAWPLENVWLGVSVESSDYFDRIQHLLNTPAAIRFISAEPLLERTDLGLRNWSHIDRDDCRLDWVIVGGESGSNARPCDVAWIGLIVEDCRLAGVSCFVKQLGARPVVNGRGMKFLDKKGGEIETWPAALRVRQMPRQPAGAA